MMMVMMMMTMMMISWAIRRGCWQQWWQLWMTIGAFCQLFAFCPFLDRIVMMMMMVALTMMNIMMMKSAMMMSMTFNWVVIALPWVVSMMFWQFRAIKWHDDIGLSGNNGFSVDSIACLQKELLTQLTKYFLQTCWLLSWFTQIYIIVHRTYSRVSHFYTFLS